MRGLHGMGVEGGRGGGGKVGETPAGSVSTMRAGPVGGPLWVSHRLCCLVGLPRPIPSFGFDYDSLF